MKRLLSCVLMATLGLGAPSFVWAATYDIDPVHSSLEFSIRHLVGKSKGRFTDFKGTIEFDEKSVATSSATATIQAASIDTDNADRDKHLRSPDFFDVEKYPEISFVSTSIKPTSEGFEMTGKLTIHGVTKVITVPVEFLGAGPDPWGKTRAGFSGEITLDRRDFGVVWNKALETGGFMLGNDVRVALLVEAIER